MFSEPDQRAPAPPLSPKPALKAKPVTLLKLGRRSNPIVAPRASLPENRLTDSADHSLQQQESHSMGKDAFTKTTVLQTAPVAGPIREYKQTSC